MIDWLKKRLTFIKKNEDRWYGLADCLEKVWEEFFDPSYNRLENLRSAYTMHHDDLNLKIRELGDYITSDLTKEDNKPIAISWRHLELDYKDLEDILSSSFRRHFGNVKIVWMPLFAPIGQPYGTNFIQADEREAIAHPELKNIPPAGYYLTSRGVISVDKDDVAKHGISQQQIIEIGNPLVRKFKPLHIVFDGFIIYGYFEIQFQAPTFTLTRKIKRDADYSYLLEDKFDLVPADVHPLDMQEMDFKKEQKRNYEVPFDVVFTAYKEKSDKPLNFTCDFTSGTRYRTNTAQFDIAVEFTAVRKEKQFEIPFDQTHNFDETPGDFFHLDNISLTAIRVTP